MAYAPYYNDIRGDRARLEGAFDEKTNGHRFEFAKRNSYDLTTFAGEYPHRIWVGPDGEDTRCALVLKTVVYVVIDEDLHGNPVVEKWSIKNFREYVI